MKKNAVVFFFKSLLKSFLVIVSVLAVGVISYKISYQVLSQMVEDGKIDPTDIKIETQIDVAKTDEISKNLIYVVDEKQNITHLMLEICNTNTCNMDYVTIPVKTDYIIPTKMYQKLCVVDEEIPQIIRMTKLRKYFANLSDEDAYGYAELIMERLLGIDISYFTVISEDVYESHYEEKSMTTTYEKVTGRRDSSSEEATEEPEEVQSDSQESYRGSVTMDVSVASKTYLNQMAAIAADKKKIVDYIEDQYDQKDKVMSNLTVTNKIGYVPTYEKMDAKLYHYWGVPGSFSGQVFTIDEASAAAFLKQLEDNTESYTDAQKVGKGGKKKAISAKGKKIIVLNGSKITGLAAAKQQELINAGFTVPEVGDYTKEILTHTRIVVAKEGMGQDLAAYFKDPEIVVGSVRKGYKIEIILGTADAN